MAGAARLPPLRRVVEGKESEDETAAPKPRNPVARQLRLATVREGDLRWIAPSVSFDLSEFNPSTAGSCRQSAQTHHPRWRAYWATHFESRLRIRVGTRDRPLLSAASGLNSRNLPVANAIGPFRRSPLCREGKLPGVDHVVGLP